MVYEEEAKRRWRKLNRGGVGPSGRLLGSETWSVPDLPTSWLAGPHMNPDPWLCLGLVTLSEVQAQRCVSSQTLVCALSPLSLPWLLLSAHSSPVREGRWGGDGEQKCQRDIKQSASVCALIVQPVWFPSPPSLPLFLRLTSPLYTLLRRAINSSPPLQISKSLCLFCSINTHITFSADPFFLPLHSYGLLHPCQGQYLQ